MSRKGILLLIVCVFALLLSGSSAARTKPLRHDRDVIRFFNHHPKQAHTIVGERALWRVLGHVVENMRTVQSAYVVSQVRTWPQAVAVVRHFYGSTIADWENECVRSEGGNGGFVWFGHLSYPKYGYSDTPGGNLQFKGGTFDNIIEKALSGARERGLVIDPSRATFFTSLGQAVAGAQMILDGRRGEWAGATC